MRRLSTVLAVVLLWPTAAFCEDEYAKHPPHKPPTAVDKKSAANPHRRWRAVVACTGLGNAAGKPDKSG